MQADAFDKAAAARIARTLIHTSRDAALGTLDKDGGPSVSHIAVATLADGAPLLLTSDLAVHTHNLRRDARASLLFVAATGEGRDTNTRGRITLTGTVAAVSDRPLARDRFLRRHPDAALYVDFGDMHLVRFEPQRAHLVAGFGRITNVAASELTSAADDAATLGALDGEACAHMNEDHLDALEVMAWRLAGAPEGSGPWTALAVDPRGMDLSDGQTTVRVEFDEPVTSAGALRRSLKELADRARARAA